MAKSVTLAIDAGAGKITLDDGVIFLGEQTPITITGVTLATGHTMRVTLFDDDRVTPLADNHTTASILDMRGAALREKFENDCVKVDASFYKSMIKKRITFYATAIEMNGSEATGEVMADGQITVEWSPAVFETASGAVATLKGPKGDAGADGQQGLPGGITQIVDASNKWHKVMAVVNDQGELVVGVDQDESAQKSAVDIKVVSSESEITSTTDNVIYFVTES